MNSLKVHIINNITCVYVNCHIIIQRNWKFGNYYITSKYLPPDAVDVAVGAIVAVIGNIPVIVTTPVVSPAIKIFVFIVLDVVIYKLLKLYECELTQSTYNK